MNRRHFLANALPSPPRALCSLLFGAAILLPGPGLSAKPASNLAELTAAIAGAADGTVIEVAAGRFELSEPLVLRSGTTLRGAGIGQTILTHSPEWKANPATLPDPETNQQKFDRSGYLIHFADKAEGIALSGMTLTGPQLHGAVFASGNAKAELHDLRIENFMYCGIRSYSLKQSKIHDCTFMNVGSRWERGQLGLKGGITGGGIFCIWTQDTEIWNNRFLETRSTPHEHYYGIKGRQGKRLKIHHNTIEVNFSIEFPFENDEDIEISHNVLHGTVSIPKHAGGAVPASGRTFHIHHNLFKDSYSIEFVRNGVEIDHNLFDFDPAKDHGNLISGFGKAPAPGPASFHHNLVRHPGRGVIWINEPYSNLDIHHNHIRCATTKTPRTEGLFGFHKECDFKTIRITDNLIECEGTPRPFLRNDESATATIENNTLSGISDTNCYANKATGQPIGPGAPLKFQCGVNDEVSVDGWKVAGPKQP
jgi:Right handed beta helix region